MAKKAYIRFYGTLNDFLPSNKKHKTYLSAINGHPNLKDFIEAQGVPHSEVYLIVQNHTPAGFENELGMNDLVSVFPAFVHESMLPKNPLSKKDADIEKKFILDVHLGKLTKYIRLAGFDAFHHQHLKDPEIAEISANENRIVLTRDRKLLMHKKIKYGHWIRSDDPEQQFIDVINRFQLKSLFHPFSRCTVCNGYLQQIPKNLVEGRVPANTDKLYSKFFQCQNCRKVYWEGSHYQKMKLFIEKHQ